MTAPLVAAGQDALMPTYRPWPVTFVEGHGTVLVDTDGKEYLDFLSGLAVTSLGHAHPGVGAAIAAQAAKLTHVSNLFGNTVAPGVAATIDRLIGGGTRAAGGKVFFANSGAEANECAIKLARRHGGRGRHVVVSAYGSFHGRTLATLHATGQPDKHEPYWPLPEGFRHVAYDDPAALERAVTGEVAAVLVEPIQGEAGVVVPRPGYLAHLRDICDGTGALLIIDEVQTGLGRCGAWFAFQDEGVLPDVVTIAKALGNGMPISACWARAGVASAFGPGDHATTFGGQPLAAAAAGATLAELERIDAPRCARERGAELAAGLAALPGVASVRGRGLLVAAELEGVAAGEVAAAALAAGLVVNAVRPTSLRFAPPLTVSAAEVASALDILAGVLAELMR